jgi:hypothetical protein
LRTYDGRVRPSPGTRTPGVEARWTRFVNGWGCHYANGYLFDDWGDDVYGGQIMGTGMAWDLAFGFLGDFGGSDRYTSTGNMKHGVGAEASIGILFSYGGDDSFAGRSQGLASGHVTYHPPASGGNFSFLINYGGGNRYAGLAQNRGNAANNANSNVLRSSYMQRGTPSGFLINRPLESEAHADLLSMRLAIEVRNREIEEFDMMIERMREEAAARGRRFTPPRQRRPQPISESQILSAVPDFGTIVRRADASEAAAR